MENFVRFLSTKNFEGLSEVDKTSLIRYYEMSLLETDIPFLVSAVRSFYV